MHLYVLVDHRNDQWIPESRLTSTANNEQIEMTSEQLNDSTNSLTGRKRARLKRRLNDVGFVSTLLIIRNVFYY